MVWSMRLSTPSSHVQRSYGTCTLLTAAIRVHPCLLWFHGDMDISVCVMLYLVLTMIDHNERPSKSCIIGGNASKRVSLFIRVHEQACRFSYSWNFHSQWKRAGHPIGSWDLHSQWKGAGRKTGSWIVHSQWKGAEPKIGSWNFHSQWERAEGQETGSWNLPVHSQWKDPVRGSIVVAFWIVLALHVLHLMSCIFLYFDLCLRLDAL